MITVRSRSLLEQMAFQISIESSIRFTDGSSSRARLKVSGARKIIACTGMTKCQLAIDKQELIRCQTPASGDRGLDPYTVVNGIIHGRHTEDAIWECRNPARDR